MDKAINLYHKLKNFLVVLDFAYEDRAFILNNHLMVFVPHRHGYIPGKAIRCKNINNRAFILWWDPKMQHGRRPTFEEFSILYN